MADEAIRNKIFAYKPLFQSTLNLLSERQKEVLYVIAKEGKAIQITSGSFNKNTDCYPQLNSDIRQTIARQGYYHG